MEIISLQKQSSKGTDVLQSLEKLQFKIQKLVKLFNFEPQQIAYNKTLSVVTGVQKNGTLKKEKTEKEIEFSIISKMKCLEKKKGYEPSEYFKDHLTTHLRSEKFAFVKKNMLILADQSKAPNTFKEVKENCSKISELLETNNNDPSLVQRLNSKLKEYLFFCKILTRNQEKEATKISTFVDTPKTQKKAENNANGAKIKRKMSGGDIHNPNGIDREGHSPDIVRAKQFNGLKSFVFHSGDKKFDDGIEGSNGTFEDYDEYGAEFKSQGPVFNGLYNRMPSVRGGNTEFGDNISQVHSTMLGSEIMQRGVQNLKVSKYFW